MTLPVLLSALAAALAAYVFNRISRLLAGRTTVIFIAPGFEESFKTGAALLTGAPVLVTHLVFGVIEALYDLTVPHPYRSGKAPRGRRTGAAVTSLGAHTLFGAVTLVVANLTYSWPVGVVAAYGLHVGWNALVTGKVRAEH